MNSLMGHTRERVDFFFFLNFVKVKYIVMSSYQSDLDIT